jgi:hypothetical protein
MRVTEPTLWNRIPDVRMGAGGLRCSQHHIIPALQDRILIEVESFCNFLIEL